MTCLQLDLQDVKDAIYVCLEERHTASIDDVAATIYVSRSTLQRVLSRAGYTFTELRLAVQLDCAAWNFIHGSRSRSHVAARVGLSREHMSKCFRAAWNLGPSDLEYLGSLYRRLAPIENWLLAAQGRTINVEEVREMTQRKQWIEAEIRGMLAQIPTDPPPVWAILLDKRLQTFTRRPSIVTV